MARQYQRHLDAGTRRRLQRLQHPLIGQLRGPGMHACRFESSHTCAMLRTNRRLSLAGAQSYAQGGAIHVPTATVPCRHRTVPRRPDGSGPRSACAPAVRISYKAMDGLPSRDARRRKTSCCFGGTAAGGMARASMDACVINAHDGPMFRALRAIRQGRPARAAIARSPSPRGDGDPPDSHSRCRPPLRCTSGGAYRRQPIQEA